MRGSTSILALPKASSSSCSIARSIRLISRETRSLHSSKSSSLLRSSTSSRSNTPTILKNGYGSIRYHGHSTSPAGAEPIDPIPDIGIENTYDIVIIGGANAGLALACALLAQPTISTTTKILLLEGSSLDKTRQWTGEGNWENRISSLTWENISWLDSIGVWKHIKDDRSCPVEEMVIWANPSPSSFPTIHFPPLGHPMARMTENMNLQRALLRRIEEVGKGIVDIKEGARVNEMRLGEGERWVGLKVGDEWLKGSLVVGADGPNSPVRLFSGIETYGRAYQTHAVVATLKHSPSPLYPNTTAFQRFLPTGPIAFLPLNEENSTMVWSTLPQHAKALKNLSKESLTQLVNAGYQLPESILTILTDQMIKQDKIGKPITVFEINEIINLNYVNSNDNVDQPILPPNINSIEMSSVASFPLKLSHAKEYLGKRTVLVGDSAHTIHPLAGQGLNQGLSDVICLSKILENSKKLGGDLGSKTNLIDYSRERYFKNHLILSTTDKLNYIFKSRNFLINLIRSNGLEIINELTPIKKFLMNGAGAAVTSTFDQTRQPDGLSKSQRREFGRSTPESPLPNIQGWQKTAASSVENWFTLKSVIGMAGGIAGGLIREGVKKATGSLQKK
ncbi:ubiquinone biosynthesis monooxygenase COQ6 [Kwoniella pini CBS 10737]|uniref:Ubiquinone biosynthesis monooxygenase COQ6, mitochondrial n=1 Tax=Kwoniella pini CBS 10737 TaxID=1296096 RepID=A0A1B9I0P6_9TREE|nr:ubiquinone biosynthesis monooxygenase COQ6 [Kwoniella pini CBS 10737]OCF49085.1 ubiquinone biosynthesis monooxygenase COQ6 [Kwoniella pini CBS 10737]